MNKSKIILGTVAFVVSAASAWAFKSNHRPIYAKTTGNGCKVTNCFTTVNSQTGTVCQTALGTSYTNLWTTAQCSTHSTTTSFAQLTN